MVEIDPSPKPRKQPEEPTELQVCPFTVAVDTREQAPWYFMGIVHEKRAWVVPAKVQTLQTGDYSIVGCEDQLTIERKSGADLVGSITAGNARFRAEHERMAEILQRGGWACVVVEDSLSEICADLDADPSRRVTGSMVLGAMASWPQRYGVPWFMAGDRRTAELLAFRIMLKWWESQNEH
jgi:ERCC4-type nuclease